jgi:protein-disulfide isomerase
MNNTKNGSCNITFRGGLLCTAIAGLTLLTLFLTFSVYRSKKNFNSRLASWVNENPKLIIDSVQRYAEKQQAESQRRRIEETSVNVKKNLEKIVDERDTGVYNANGTKSIVIFFDYNCGYCKMASKALEEVVKVNKEVKVIFRDYPIFGGISSVAAKYSIAVAMTEGKKFFDFHAALMNGNAKDEDGIKDALREAKINIEKVRRTMRTKTDEIDKRIEENRAIAETIGIQGTPALVIGEDFIPGYLDAETILGKLK